MPAKHKRPGKTAKVERQRRANWRQEQSQALDSETRIKALNELTVRLIRQGTPRELAESVALTALGY